MVAKAETLKAKPERLQAVAPAVPEERASALEQALRAAIAGEVRFDNGSRALYATDGSNYRQVPVGVVLPKTTEDIVATVRLCRHYDVPVTARGGGTSLAGNSCNVAVVIDTSKYLHDIIELDPAAKTAIVQPGCILDHLRDSAEAFQLTFGPDPATHDHNSLGGMIGNNSCGPHSIMAGRTADNVEALEILTYDGERFWVGETTDEEMEEIISAGGRRGEIYARLKALRERYAEDIRDGYRDIPRRVSGYNLPQLLPENRCNIARALVGSEGTCVFVLQAKLRLIHSPPKRALVVLGFEDVYRAGDAIPQVLAHKPVATEGLDDRLIDYVKKKQMQEAEHLDLLPEGGGWLLVEFGADDQDELERQVEALAKDAKNFEGNCDIRRLLDKDEQEQVWKIRETGLAATAHVPGSADTWPGWEDAAVPPDKVGAYLRDFRALLERYDYECSMYGHFGDGCIHVRIDFDLETEDGIQKYRRFLEDAADLVNGYGGSFSGEHGDGQARAELLPKMYGPKLMQAMREFKSIWDPQGRMNPGKVIDPYPITANLRLGTEFRPKEPKTYYAYPEDKGSFVGASIRCVGVGKCRQHSGGVMCPSYMATWEEEHSTRGRARMLFEMVHGGPIQEGWKSDHVHDALDLCLACKGCKKDCPVSVDMATYKSEFNAHYWQGRLRPRSHYAFGLLPYWARAAAKAPGLANFLTQAPGVSRLAKTMGGVAPERELPEFAAHTFQDWYRVREKRQAQKKVVLFADTFNNYFRPEIAKSALEVLEWAGYEVKVPVQKLCCGRPMYDIGMLGSAKRLLRGVMEALDPLVQLGLPVLGLEPACVSAFRDELPNLFPDDPRAKRLSENTYLFTEFLAQQEDFEPPKLQDRAAVVHNHCHHHAVIGTGTEQQLLEAMALDSNVLDSGCCGMAGAFGFEREHYQVSIDAGERVLLPAVRSAPEDALIITNGFSCAEQVRLGAGVRPLHMAEVMHKAIWGSAQ